MKMLLILVLPSLDFEVVYFTLRSAKSDENITNIENFKELRINKYH